LLPDLPRPIGRTRQVSNQDASIAAALRALSPRPAARICWGCWAANWTRLTAWAAGKRLEGPADRNLEEEA